jgi:hypothetical protein
VSPGLPVFLNPFELFFPVGLLALKIITSLILLYGFKCWTSTKRQKNRIKVAGYVSEDSCWTHKYHVDI